MKDDSIDMEDERIDTGYLVNLAAMPYQQLACSAADMAEAAAERIAGCSTPIGSVKVCNSAAWESSSGSPSV
jgi:hypothetical protein